MAVGVSFGVNLAGVQTDPVAEMFKKFLLQIRRALKWPVI